MLIEINNNNIDIRLIKDVVKELKKGELIIYPTDSVYGIGCDLTNKKALEKLADFKNQKLQKSRFSIICKDLSQVSQYTQTISQSTFKLMKKAFPGPFTFILNASNDVAKLFGASRSEIGVRIPDNNIVKAIVEELGNPLATTSLHDEDDSSYLEYFTDPYQIFEKYDDKVKTIIDGGMGKIEASTVIDCTQAEPVLIRQGAGEV